MINGVNMTEYNLFKLTHSQIDKIKEDIKVKYEAIYQWEAYYNLVTNNLDRLAKEFSIALCEPSKFYFTVKFSNGKIEFDYIPDILNDLQNGDSALIFWKPPHQELMGVINYEYRQNPEKYTE